MVFVLLEKGTVLQIHDSQLERHGGLQGIRDEGMLESALGRAENLIHYGGDNVAIQHVAASLAFGIAKNHPFIDGNKRTSLVVALTTLVLNGRTQRAPMPAVLETWQNLAAGLVGEEALAAWLEAHTAAMDR